MIIPTRLKKEATIFEWYIIYFILHEDMKYEVPNALF